MKSILLSLFVILLSLASCSKEETSLNGPDEMSNGNPVTPNPAVDTTGITSLKSGKFSGASGYPANGTSRLAKNKKNEYSIILDKDFSTSFATGSVTMYLSRTSKLNFNDVESFIKLAVVDKNGYHYFPLKSMPNDDMVNVVVWCQPAGVKFGHAELK